MARYRVGVARFPGSYREHPCSSGYVIELALRLQNDREIELVPWKKTDTPITMVRNLCVWEALGRGRGEFGGPCDYLLMIDSDMEPDPRGEDGKLLYDRAVPFWDAAWGHMMRHRDAPCAVGAPYCGPSPHQNVYVFRWSSRCSGHPNPNWSLEQYGRDEAALMTGISEVAALPTGLILYDLRAFQNMRPPWFYYEYVGDGPRCESCGREVPGPQTEKASTEDVVQTRDMSLAWYASRGKAGGRVFCAWDSWAHHIKPEHVPKPQIVTADMIGASFKHAVEVGLRSDERIMHMEKHPWENAQRP